MIKIIDIANNVRDSYAKVCDPICKEFELPKVALDIILFLSNHKDLYTAKDIVKYRDIKPNLVSLYVDKLVSSGYLKRESIENDRRKIKLICTDKTQPIIEKGHAMQKKFVDDISNGLSEQEQKIMIECLIKLNNNAIKIIEKDI